MSHYAASHHSHLVAAKLICHRVSLFCLILHGTIVSEYDQEVPQLQTADKPMALRGRATQQPRDTRKTN